MAAAPDDPELDRELKQIHRIRSMGPWVFWIAIATVPGTFAFTANVLGGLYLAAAVALLVFAGLIGLAEFVEKSLDAREELCWQKWEERNSEDQ